MADSNQSTCQRSACDLITQTLSNESVLRYSRQVILPQVAPQGQLKLEQSRVLVIGAGGLGCPAALYLAAAGVGCIGIVDGDQVELHNLHRQVLHTTDGVGKLKSVSAIESLSELNPRIKYRSFAERLTNKNALDIIEQFDLVVDSTDNPPTRYLVNDACVLTGRPLVCASALRFDGQLTVYNRDADSPCYRCVFPQAPRPDAVGRCAEQGVVGAVCGVMGALQALEAIKVLLTLKGDSDAGTSGKAKSSNGEPEVLSGRMFVFDGLRGEFRVVQLRNRSSDCAVCSKDASMRTITRESYPTIDYVAFCHGVPLCDAPQPVILQLVDLEDRISPSVYLRDFALGSRQHLLLDVRPQLESDIFRLTSAIAFPLAYFGEPAKVEWLKSIIADAAQRAAVKAGMTTTGEKCDMPVVTVCRRGNTSQRALLKLRELLANEAAVFNQMPARIVLTDIVGGYCELAKVKAAQVTNDNSSDTLLHLPLYF